MEKERKKKKKRSIKIKAINKKNASFSLWKSVDKIRLKREKDYHNTLVDGGDNNI